MFIIIHNQGQAIRSTSYWDSEQAKAGYVYLSWNAGAGRLLIPDRLKPILREMRDAREVLVSRGPWVDQATATPWSCCGKTAPTTHSASTWSPSRPTAASRRSSKAAASSSPHGLEEVSKAAGLAAIEWSSASPASRHGARNDQQS